jgi:hypothetical protein
MAERRPDGAGGEVLIEFIVQGSVVKVTAIDPKSGIEASIVGPASAPRSVLEGNAVKKLVYVLKKQRGEA